MLLSTAILQGLSLYTIYSGAYLMKIGNIIYGCLLTQTKRYIYEVPITSATHALGGLFLYSILHNNSHLENL